MRPGPWLPQETSQIRRNRTRQCVDDGVHRWPVRTFFTFFIPLQRGRRAGHWQARPARAPVKLQGQHDVHRRRAKSQ